MKIIYLHQYFVTPNMSGSTRSYEFAKRLVRMGHEVEMITCWREPYQSKDWFLTEEDGIKVHWLPLVYSNNMNFFQRIKSFILFAWKSTFRAIKLNADIIFASSTPLTISIPAVYISRKKKIPMVFEVRDLWPDVPIAMKILKNSILIYLSKLLEIWAYNNANSIIALSPEMKSGIVSKNINSKKIAVIPNCSDLEDFKYNEKLAHDFRNQRSWLKNNPLLVYAGTFGKVNDLSYAIYLAESLMKKNSKLKILLVGDGREKKKLIEQAKKKNVFEKNLFFESPIPKKEMQACLSAANICANFVIDIRENWANSANKFFDGLAAGKPIFLNHGGWMEDLVSTYDCGLCMHGKKIETVADELNLAVSNNFWLKSSGEVARKLAEKFFDRNILAQKLDQILTLTKNNRSEFVENIANGIYK
jgi:glycosyltransferase involved in cell wall biosynthesis